MGACCVNELSEIPETVDLLGEGGMAKPRIVPQLQARTGETQDKVEAPPDISDVLKNSDGVAFDFWDETSSSMVQKVFTSRPLGMSYYNEVPLIINRLKHGGNADKLGVQTGWVIKAVNGRNLSGTTFEEDTSQLLDQLKNLPEIVDPFGKGSMTKPMIVAQIQASTGEKQAKIEG